MTNWEEYNAIDPALNQLESIQSSPQFYVTTIGTAPALQQWASISVDASFGSFASAAVLNASGPTADPNNPDTDGDGIIDGMEVLFTAWNDSAQTWTLNPMVPDDGDFDADGDGLLDRQELALAFEQPDNGEVHPADAPCSTSTETTSNRPRNRSASSASSSTKTPAESDTWPISTVGSRVGFPRSSSPS